jgi:hypothetical protein
MKTLYQRLGKLIAFLAIVAAGLSVVGCCDDCKPKEKQRILDSVMNEILGVSAPQGLINPDFTDLGVGSLLSSGRMRMTESNYQKLVDSIVKVLKSPSYRLNAPPPDVCMPPNHWGTNSSPMVPPILWWLPLHANQIDVLTQTYTATPSVIDDLERYMDEFWAVQRGTTGSPPVNMAFELVGLNLPMSLPGPFHGYTSVSAPVSTSSTYRVVLNY